MSLNYLYYMLIVSPGPCSLSSENGVTLDIQHHQNEQGCKINKNSSMTEKNIAITATFINAEALGYVAQTSMKRYLVALTWMRFCFSIMCKLQPNFSGSNIFGTIKDVRDRGSSS